MKKRIVLAVAIFLASGSMALAGNSNLDKVGGQDRDAGCGVGTGLLLDGSDKSILRKVLAVTTNQMSSQTFGITTGTSGCSENGALVSNQRLNMFAGANIDKLAADMAVGDGETLDSMAEIMGIDDSQRPAFYSLLKDNYGTIFISDDVTAGEVLASINKLLAVN